MPRLLRSLLLNVFRKRRVEADLDDEVRAYCDWIAAEKERGGLPRDQAARQARIEMGGLDLVKENVRETRAGAALEDFVKDLRYAARALRRNPAFCATAVLALALGIGATTAMFSVVDGLLLSPLPYPDPGRLVSVYLSYKPRDAFRYGTMCVKDFLIWRENNRAFDEIALFRSNRMDLAGGDAPPEQLQAVAATASFFSILGVRPMMGRTVAAAEDTPGAAVALIRERLWRRRFSADPAIVGRTIQVNGVPTTVIGVMPDSFRYPREDTDLWTNLPMVPPTRFGPWFYRGLARLKPGGTLDQAHADLDVVAGRLMQQNSYYRGAVLPILPLRDSILGVTIRPALFVLSGAVALVLLIALVNVANLMLARATVREREMALRLSLGARRGRLIRQLLTESLLLSIFGGAAGLIVAAAAISGIRVWNPGDLPFVDSVSLDARAFLFAACASTLAAFLFGLVPALTTSRTDMNSVIKEGGRGSAGGARTHARSALVVAEIALSSILLLGAGLLLRSFVNLERVDGGFSAPPQRLLSMLVSPNTREYKDPAALQGLYAEILRRTRALPGVDAAAIGDSLPPDRQGDADSFSLEDRKPGETYPVLSHITAGDDFFRVLGIPLLLGRAFDPHDTAQSAKVVIVSDGFARRFLPGQNPLTKRLGYDGNWYQIVGVAGNVKYLGQTLDTDAAYYIPYAQSPWPRMFLVTRTSRDAAGIAAAVAREVQSVNRGLTLSQIGTMEDAVARSVSQPRFNTLILACFAAIALLLASVGVYGLVAYSVAQRTHEIGIRMALGAARGDVLRLILSRGAALATVGVVIGLAGAAGLAQLLQAMLFGIGAIDTVTFVVVPLCVLLVALLAMAAPALRAARISPVRALRSE